MRQNNFLLVVPTIINNNAWIAYTERRTVLCVSVCVCLCDAYSNRCLHRLSYALRTVYLYIMDIIFYLFFILFFSEK